VRCVKVLLKIILFPISILLTIIVAVFSFLIEKCAMVLNILSGLLFLLAVTAFLRYFIGWPFSGAGEIANLQGGIIIGIVSFLLSPYGLPTALIWIVAQFAKLNDAIKAI